MTPARSLSASPPRRAFHRHGGVLRKLLVIALLFTLLIFSGAVWAYWKRNSLPLHRIDHDRHLAVTSLDDRRIAAENLEKRLIGAFSLTDPRSPTPQNSDGLGERTIRVTAGDINDWLETRSGLYPQRLVPGQEGWFQQQGIALPRDLSEPEAGIENGALVGSITVDFAGRQEVVTVLLDTQVVSPGLLRVRISRVKLGDLPLPIRFIAGRLPAKIARQIEPFLDWREIPASWDMPGSPPRKATVKNLQIEDQTLIVTLQISARP